MMRHIADKADHIYLALGATDFRKQTNGLAAIISLQFKRNPHEGNCVFLFCNKSKAALRALRWDRNGFILATKTLTSDFKFQWPKSTGDVRDITSRQLEWLLDGLVIDQKKALPTTVDASRFQY